MKLILSIVVLISVLSFMLLIGTGAVVAQTCSTKTPDCDPRASLAYDYLQQRFGSQDSALDVWVYKAYGPEGKAHLEHRMVEFEKVRAWARTLPAEDGRAYLGWLDYYEDGVRGALAEWHTHKLQQEQAAYSKHLKECAEAARLLAASKKPLPKLPELGLLK